MDAVTGSSTGVAFKAVIEKTRSKLNRIFLNMSWVVVCSFSLKFIVYSL